MVFLMYLVCLLFPKSGFSRNLPPHTTFSFRYGQVQEYTWRNSAVYHVGIFNEQLLCFSTLLTLEHTLTTAGCFVPKGTDVTKMLAYGGTIFYYHQDPRAQVRAVKEVIIHEKYTIEGVPNNDIALVVVAPPFVQTFRLGVAHLPSRYIINPSKPQAVYINQLKTGRTFHKTKATIVVEGAIIAERSFIQCKLCEQIFNAGEKVFDKNGTYVGKFMCPRWKSKRFIKLSNIIEYTTCYTTLGNPVMSYSHEIIAMYSMSTDEACATYPGFGKIYMRVISECDSHKDESKYIQVFPYVDWIKSNIKENRVIRFRPYRIPTKDINLKPYIPIIVYITLFVIVIVVFLICNRAVFGRVRF